MSTAPASLRRAARVLVIHDVDGPDAVLAGWIVDACASQGVVASARTVGSGSDDFSGSLLEIAASDGERADVTGVAPEVVDLVIASDLGRLARVLATTGLAHPEQTAVVAASESAPAGSADPRWRVPDDELHAYVEAHSWKYASAPLADMLEWSGTARAFAPALLLGIACGAGLLGLDARGVRDLVARTYADPAPAQQALTAFEAGYRHGAGAARRPTERPGASRLVREYAAALAPIQRTQLRTRLQQVEDEFEPQLAAAIQRAAAQVAAADGYDPAQELVALMRQTRVAASTMAPGAADAVLKAVARQLASLMTPHDRTELAARMLRLHERDADSARRAGDPRVVGRRTYRVPDELLAEATDDWASVAATFPRIVTLDPDRTRDARQLAALARERDHAARRRERARLRSLAGEYIEAVIDAMPLGYAVTRVVADSASLVGGWGTSRRANEMTARTFWGRVVRQALAVDHSRGLAGELAGELIRSCWSAMATRGPIVLWDVAAHVVALGMRASRGASDDELLAAGQTLLARTA